MTSTDARPRVSGERLHGLDALRAGALGLGIVLHSLLPFTPGIPWLFADSDSTLLALVGIYWIQLFRMVVFMALAGYFARMVLHRRGAASFLKDRGLRLGLPVIAFWPVAVFPLSKIADADADADAGPPGAGELQSHPAEGIPELLLLFPTWHLWFLVVLLQCILIAIGIRGVVQRMIGAERSERIAGRLGAVFSSPPGMVLAAVPYLACLLIQGDVQGGIYAPTTLLPSLSALTAYGRGVRRRLVPARQGRVLVPGRPALARIPGCRRRAVLRWSGAG